MAPTIKFYGHDGATSTIIHNLAGSGLGFFGASFNTSVQVGSFNETTFITDEDGTEQGPAVQNVQYIDAASGIVNGAVAGTGLQWIPNNSASMRVEFIDTQTREIQNAEFRAYDRVDKDYSPSGVTVRVAEIIHPSPLLNIKGSGDSVWWGDPTHTVDTPTIYSAANYPGSPNQDARLSAGEQSTVGGSGIIVPLSPGPGLSGHFAGDGGDGVSSLSHDWYLAISVSPNSIGNKTQFGGHFSLEYF